MDNNKNIERFRSIIATINRPGIDKLMKFIEEKSDFYTAPASTKYHLSCEGGLLQHSLNVYDALMQLKTVEPLRTALARHDNASIAIVALFHDLCKTMFYKVSNKERQKRGNRKMGEGAILHNRGHHSLWARREIGHDDGKLAGQINQRGKVRNQVAHGCI